MTLIPQPTRIMVHDAQRYIEDQINKSNNALRNSEREVKRLTNEGIFSATDINAYKQKLINDAKDATKNAIGMYRWLLSELNISPIPRAFTDADVDAIDPEIRQIDDGN